jgi:hypothetical protein
MILAPEISTLTDETVPLSETLNSPVFANRSADTVCGDTGREDRSHRGDDGR